MSFNAADEEFARIVTVVPCRQTLCRTCTDRARRIDGAVVPCAFFSPMTPLRGSCVSESEMLALWIRANSQRASSLADEPSAGILRVGHSRRC